MDHSDKSSRKNNQTTMSIYADYSNPRGNEEASQSRGDNLTLTEDYLTAQSTKDLMESITKSTNMTSNSNRRRRMSVDDSVAQLIYKIRETMDQMGTIWDSMGLSQRHREKRIEQAYKHFYTLLDIMVEEEGQMEQGLRREIAELQQNINKLQEKLQLKKLVGSEHNCSSLSNSSVQLFKALSEELDFLRKKEKLLIKEQVAEFRLLQRACVRLGREPPDLYQNINEAILSCADRRQLTEDCKKAEDDVGKRVIEIAALQSKAKRVFTALNVKSVNDKERFLLEANFKSDDKTVISDAVLARLEQFCQKHEQAYKAWGDAKARDYDELLFNLTDLQCKLFQKTVSYPDHFDPLIHDDDLLQRLREDVQRLSAHYEYVGPIMQLYATWYDLWKENCRLEEQSNDPNFYRNVGLLKQNLDRKNYLHRAVPATLKQLREVITEYQNDGRDMTLITIEGMRADAYADFLLNERAQQREIAKLNKMSAPRPKTIIKSVGHGTVMSTPGGNKTRTRLFAPTPVAVQGGSTTPRRWDASKNNGRIRPILASKISRRRRSKSFSNSQMSQLSSISPKRRIENGPTTSSPWRRLAPANFDETGTALSPSTVKRRRVVLFSQQPHLTPLRTPQRSNTSVSKERNLSPDMNIHTDKN